MRSVQKAVSLTITFVLLASALLTPGALAQIP